MKIEKNLIRRMTLEEFAEEHDLTMEINERDSSIVAPRYYAQFKYSELEDGSVFIGIYGNGHTEEGAIKDYEEQLSKLYGRKLIFNAFTPERQEIVIPVFVSK